jgi:hypothetical protein
MQKIAPQGKGMQEKRFAVRLPEEVVAGFGWEDGVCSILCPLPL